MHREGSPGAAGHLEEVQEQELVLHLVVRNLQLHAEVPEDRRPRQRGAEQGARNDRRTHLAGENLKKFQLCISMLDKCVDYISLHRIRSSTCNYSTW